MSPLLIRNSIIMFPAIQFTTTRSLTKHPSSDAGADVPDSFRALYPGLVARP